ncbi:MAG TPA: ABC transporter substrate-binding protein [Terriglobales bacterium]|jgi:ABC-type nitrate/sulfonate/bicarbonate transport system substrate-binding protein|nr:ABC transporter substrate-binding protein [Terriglobales bacterium]
MISKWLCTILLALLLPIHVAAQETNLVAYAGFAGFQAPIWAPKDLGLFAKYAFNGDLVFLSGSVRQIQALLGGSIQFAQADAATALNAINQGADMVIISSSLNSFPYSFVTTKELRKPEDLVGKKIGILAVGGATETATLLALKAWNIPRQAVTIFPAGDSAARIVAISAKAIDGTMLSYPDINEALRLGMHEFAKMSDVKGSSFPMNVMIARRSYVEKNRDTVKRFQQAYAEGVYQFMNNKEKGLAVLGKWLRYRNPKTIEDTYNYFAKSFAFPTRVSLEGLRNTLEIIGQRNPALKVDMNVNRYLDESSVDELEREGFFKRLAAR